MAEPGDTIENAVSGERLTFRRTGSSTGGRALELEWTVPSGSRLVALPHRHPTNDEHFELLEGTARFRVGRRKETRSAPHTFTVPRDTGHVHPANVGDTPLRVRQWIELDESRPDLLTGVERYFETIAALARERRVTRFGLIRNPLQFSLTVSELLFPNTYLSIPPPAIQAPPVKVIAALARRLGMQAYHEPARQRDRAAEPAEESG